MSPVPKAGVTSGERRAAITAGTRARILAAAKALMLDADGDLSVDDIARRAGVAVQSIYDHFGSKGGLLIAVVQDVQRSGGLFEGIQTTFRSPDGETALRTMIAATVGMWDHAWPFLAFLLRARRSDPVVGREYAGLDVLRHAHLWAICRRLEEEGRVRGGSSAEWAADQAFVLSAETVYEDYVVRRGWSVQAATDSITRAITAVVLEPGTVATTSPAPDWPVLESEAAARAVALGADASRFPVAWQRQTSKPAVADNVQIGARPLDA